jgi:tetratricopeptide (TPR) repeat protein
MKVKQGILFFFLVAGSVVCAQDQKWKAWETEADTLFNRQEFEEASGLYTKIIEATKLNDKEAYPTFYKRAVCYYSLGNFEKALEDLDVFIPAFPDMYRAKLLRAFVYKELGDEKRQLIDLNEVLDAQPGNPDLLRMRASIYLSREEFKKAKEDLDIAKSLQDDSETEVYLGVAHYNMGDLDSALFSINRSIEMDATYMPSYLYAGSFCLQEEQYELGIKYLNLALRLEPKNTSALFYKGVALVELKKVALGCSFLAKAFYNGEDDAGGYLQQYCYSMDN